MSDQKDSKRPIDVSTPLSRRRWYFGTKQSQAGIRRHVHVVPFLRWGLWAYSGHYYGYYLALHIGRQLVFLGDREKGEPK